MRIARRDLLRRLEALENKLESTREPAVEPDMTPGKAYLPHWLVEDWKAQGIRFYENGHIDWSSWTEHSGASERDPDIPAHRFDEPEGDSGG